MVPRSATFALFLLGTMICSAPRANVGATPNAPAKETGNNTFIRGNTSIFLTRARSALRQWKFGASLHYLAQCIRSANATRGEKLEASTLRARVHQAVGQLRAGMKDAKVAWPDGWA